MYINVSQVDFTLYLHYQKKCLFIIRPHVLFFLTLRGNVPKWPHSQFFISFSLSSSISCVMKWMKCTEFSGPSWSIQLKTSSDTFVDNVHVVFMNVEHWTNHCVIIITFYCKIASSINRIVAFVSNFSKINHYNYFILYIDSFSAHRCRLHNFWHLVNLVCFASPLQATQCSKCLK